MNKTRFILICLAIWITIIGGIFYHPDPSEAEIEFIEIHGEIEDSCYPHVCDVNGEKK